MSVNEKILTPLLPLYDLKRPIKWKRGFNRSGPLDVEIGFGQGEFLVETAKSNPKRNYVGIEQNWERIYKTLRTINRTSSSRQPLDNIKILKVDAWVAFERLFDQNTIDQVYCLFPCPWPKKGHIKHRLFSNNFLRLLNSRLKRDGKITLVTDFHPFLEWVLEQANDTGFSISHKHIKPRYNTKFEKKWCAEGQEEFYEVEFQKEQKEKYDVKKDARLKTYKFNNFDPEKFNFSDEKGDISVILKEFVYDAIKKIGYVYVVVSEEHLTQHFRAAIVYSRSSWRVCRAEGQTFFPTAGIARALQLIFEAAKKTSA